MELTIQKSELSKIMSVVSTVVQKKTTMPILVNVLLSAQDGELSISATDLEIAAQARASADISKAGSTTVNARVFGDIIRELPDSDVRLSVGEEDMLSVECGNSHTKIICINADEYPGLPGHHIRGNSTISARQLSEMINKTVYSVSLDETRFNLNGVCFEAVGSDRRRLRMVATDGHRLALIERDGPAIEIEEESVLIPRKGLLEVKKLLDEEVGDREVAIAVSEGFFVVESDLAKISVRLIDGEFPDYNQVIPREKGTRAEVNSSELLAALRRVSLLVTDKAKGARFDFSSDTLAISSSSPELGEAREEVPVKYEGEPLSIGFNARYIMDVIVALEEPTNLVMELNGELGPGKLYAEQDRDCIAIVMPMRLSVD
ncbi:MAG: DNA polymerase III subunit beta [Candidatus Dadabacteria bacterium]|nr:MAG: DNA polymerase III subunit beta [Candidatus Dadabacteria bacterium]